MSLPIALVGRSMRRRQRKNVPSLIALYKQRAAPLYYSVWPVT